MNGKAEVGGRKAGVEKSADGGRKRKRDCPYLYPLPLYTYSVACLETQKNDGCFRIPVVTSCFRLPLRFANPFSSVIKEKL
jgi:hypothetical protein